MRAAFCAAHETHLAGVTDGAGAWATPPVLRRLPSRGRPGGLLTPQCRCRKPPSKRWGICAPFASWSVAYATQITHGTQCTFDADFCFRIRLRRPSHDQRRAVLAVVKALAALDPAGYGLDGASAQLEVALM